MAQTKAQIAAQKLFPDTTQRGPAPRKFMPFTPSTTKPLNQVDVETVTATGGTRTYTVGDQTTSALAYNASAGTITTALEALSNVGSGDVGVTQTGTYVNTFVWQAALKNEIVEFSVNIASLTGGTSTIANRGASMKGIMARQDTQEALARGGFARPSSMVANDQQVLAQRTPKDIGDPDRIPGEA